MDEIAARLLQLESVATQSIDRATRAEAALQHVMGTVTSLQAAAASTPQVMHAPPPPPFALVDTRQLGKPKTFNGSDAAWRGFRFFSDGLRGRRGAPHGGTHAECDDSR